MGIVWEVRLKLTNLYTLILQPQIQDFIKMAYLEIFLVWLQTAM